MRIDRLNLLAYGAFTERVLDFDSEVDALQIVYGPNEAGKSTALRAITDLFFGIPMRTSYNFLHSNSDLRISALLRSDDGASISITRLKRNSNALQDPDGNPIQEAVLLAALYGTGRETFEAANGIDHIRLAAGGKDLIEGKGDLAESLFQGATGLVGIRDKIKKLESDADEIYTPTAKNKPLNTALKQVPILRKQVKENSELTTKWDALRKEVQKKQIALDDAENKIKSTRRRKEALSAYRHSYEDVTRRSHVLRDLADLQGVLILPTDAREKRIQAQTDFAKCQREIDDTLAKLGKREEAISGLAVPELLLAAKAQVLQLEARLGADAKAALDKSELEVEERRHLRDAAEVLRELRPDLEVGSAEQLRLTALQQDEITRLVRENEALITRTDATERDLKRCSDLFAELEPQLQSQSATPNTAELRSARQRALRDAGIEEQVKELFEKASRFQNQLPARAASMGLYTGELERLESLPIPLNETIARFEQSLTQIESAIAQEAARAKSLNEQLEAARNKLASKQLLGDVATSADLSSARDFRDGRWHAVRAAWLQNDTTSISAEGLETNADLANAFETAERETDAIADAIGRDSELAGAVSQIRHEIEDLERKVEQARVKEADARLQLTSITSEWKKLWADCSLIPLPPAEMRAWAAAHAAIVTELREYRENNARRDALDEKSEEHRLALISALAPYPEVLIPSGATLAELLEITGTVISDLERTEITNKERQTQIEKLLKERSQHETVRYTLHVERADLDSKWDRVIAPLGMAPSPDYRNVALVLKRLDQMFAYLKESKDKRDRINGIDRDARDLRKDFNEFVAAVCPEFVGIRIEEALGQVRAALDSAVGDKKKRDLLASEIDGLRADLESFQIAKERATRTIQELIQAAQCSDEQELEAAEESSATASQLKDELKQLENRLRVSAGLLSVGEFCELALQEDRFQLDDQIESTERELDGLDTKRMLLVDELGAARRALELIDGGQKAADSAIALESELARVRSLTEDYTLLKLSCEVLRRAMEMHRQRNEDPVIRRAGELFKQLTLGSFTGIETDYDEKDNPRLVGLRPEGTRSRRIEIAGMSSGTADQLYLALRIASLERQLADGRRLPLIVDDVLVHFDDQRSQAALEVFAELAKRTQVIYFTHHQRILDLAESAEGCPHKVHHLAIS